MIHTLTMNPAVDRTLQLSEPLKPGGVNRVSGMITHPGGKGINVSKVLSASEREGNAYCPAFSGCELLRMLGDVTVKTIDHPVRTNLSLVDADGETTTFNQPGFSLTMQEAARLRDMLLADLPLAQWVVLAGSLPPGIDDSFYHETIVAIRQVNPDCRIALDTSGAPLLATIKQNAAPTLIKPNSTELAQLLGRSEEEFLGQPAKAIEASYQLFEYGIDRILLTMGAEGAALIYPDQAWYAQAPQIVSRSTVGAGDAALAGYLIAETEGSPAPECLAMSVRYGSTAAALPGTAAPSRQQAMQVRVIVDEWK